MNTTFLKKIFNPKYIVFYFLLAAVFEFLSSDLFTNLHYVLDILLDTLFVGFYILSIMGSAVTIMKLLKSTPRLIRLILKIIILIISVGLMFYIFNAGSGYELVDIFLSIFAFGGILIFSLDLRDFMDNVFSVKLLHKITVDSIMKLFVFTIAGLFILTALLFKANVYMYQQVINEGSALMEERCNLIESEINKNRTLQADIRRQILRVDSDEDFQMFEEIMWEFRYRLQNEAEIAYEWNQKQEAFLNKWETRFFTKKDLYDLFKVQLDMYESERKYSIALADLIENPYKEHITSELNNAAELLDVDRELYTEYTHNAQNSYDYRRPYLDIPIIHCTSEDFDSPGIPQDYEGSSA